MLVLGENMQNYDDLIARYEIVEKLNKKEVEQLYDDMYAFVHEDHPSSEKSHFYPLGLMESLTFLLDDSNPEKRYFK